jgi:hypothetical protein
MYFNVFTCIFMVSFRLFSLMIQLDFSLLQEWTKTKCLLISCSCYRWSQMNNTDLFLFICWCCLFFSALWLKLIVYINIVKISIWDFHYLNCVEISSLDKDMWVCLKCRIWLWRTFCLCNQVYKGYYYILSNHG